MNDYVKELKDLLSDFDKLEEKIPAIYTHSLEKEMKDLAINLLGDISLMKNLAINLLIDIEKKES